MNNMKIRYSYSKEGFFWFFTSLGTERLLKLNTFHRVLVQLLTKF